MVYAECDGKERLNPHNIMAACLMGCDELFEHGYVHVDDEGRIRLDGRAREHPGVLDVAHGLDGRPCAAFNDESERFFRYHRERFAAGA
jgi:hypothetical protein